MPSARDFYYRTFAKVALFPYVGGTIFHLFRLITGHLHIPFEVDYVVVFVGGYSGAGFVLFWRRVPFRQLWARILHGLVAVHLLGSVVLHAWAIVVNNHDLFRVFSYGYSYFALAYFLVLGGYCFALQRRISAQYPKER